MFSLIMISDMLSKHVGSVKSVLKKRFKINDIQLVLMFGSVIFSESMYFFSLAASFLFQTRCNSILQTRFQRS